MIDVLSIAFGISSGVGIGIGSFILPKFPEKARLLLKVQLIALAVSICCGIALVFLMK